MNESVNITVTCFSEEIHMVEYVSRRFHNIAIYPQLDFARNYIPVIQVTYDRRVNGNVST